MLFRHAVRKIRQCTDHLPGCFCIMFKASSGKPRGKILHCRNKNRPLVFSQIKVVRTEWESHQKTTFFWGRLFAENFTQPSGQADDRIILSFDSSTVNELQRNGTRVPVEPSCQIHKLGKRPYRCKYSRNLDGLCCRFSTSR